MNRNILVIQFSLFIYGILFNPIITKGQEISKKDTVIILSLGKTNIYSEAINYKVKSIETGLYHLTLLSENGDIVTWFDPNASWIANPIINEKVLRISSGEIHSVVLYPDSSINQYFLLPEITMFYPYKMKGVVEIRSGTKMSTALTRKNILYTWGPGKTVKNLKIPLKTYGVKTASVGKNHISFINIKDKVFVWGDHSLGQNNKPVFKSKPIKIASGDYHTIVLDDLNNVYAWGNNSKGQCIVPLYTGNVTHISAKQNYSLLQTNENNVLIWGMGTNVTCNFSKLGTVKTSAMGTDFAVIVVESNQKNISQWFADRTIEKEVVVLKQDSATLLSDTLLPQNPEITAKDFIKETLNHNYNYNASNGNSVAIESINSTQVDNQSNTSIEFEGENNTLLFRYENVNIQRLNSKQRIIVKGSNRSQTITMKNQNSNIVNEDSEVIIDLDQTGEENSYPAEYKYIEENLSEADNQTIELDELPYSGITEWPEEDGYFIEYGAIIGAMNNCTELTSNVMTLSENKFIQAQAFFHCKQYEKGIELLKRGAEEPEFNNCALALFEIYYYGLFNQPISIPKAKYYCMKFQSK